MTQIFKIFWLKYQDLNFQKDKLNCLEMQLNMGKKTFFDFQDSKSDFQEPNKKKE